ncbi:hypothetical protein GQ53DRAFT_834024 [Thozetella sp. PMI_491]|nr:hypothetical protein GQ53DRAFT_834024 [Thozetella sp. PMI_491]
MGQMFVISNVMTGMGVIRPAVLQSYGSPSLSECASPIGEVPTARDSSACRDILSPNTGAVEPIYHPLFEKMPAAQKPAPPPQTRKRSARVGEADKKAEERKPRKKRGRFDLPERIETSITRSWGACLRCHNQRVRCTPNPDNPNDPDMPCQTCLAVDMSTKKAIHQLPCLRYRLQNIIMHRSGGLGITNRFKHTELVDLFDYADPHVRTLEISQGICKNPIRVIVRRFKASGDDNLSRVVAVDMMNRPIAYPLAPFCLSDVELTASDFKKYLNDNALEGLVDSTERSEDFIKATYRMIVQHYLSLPDEVAIGKSGNKVQNEEKKILRNAIVFWFALRHMVGSSWISGGDLDGLHKIRIPYDEIDGKISTPRMIIAQFESIYHERILKHQNPAVLKSLQKLYYTNNLQSWFTIYSITFMLLHYVSLASADRKRWAKQRKHTETRYGLLSSPLTKYIEELQEGANYLLAHWHYYKHGVDLLSFDWEQQGESSMKHLTSEQTDWMQTSCNLLKKQVERFKHLSTEDRWDDELYFVSKMYDLTWSPDQTFRTTKTLKSLTQDASDEK